MGIVLSLLATPIAALPVSGIAQDRSIDVTLLSSPDSPEVTLDELIQRTRTNYSGRLLVGEDLMRLEIGESVGVYRFPY